MATIYLHHVHLAKPGGDDVTGVEFSIEYAPGRQAEVSILDMPPVSGSAPFAEFRAELVRLAQAIEKMAQEPRGILWLPRDEP